MSTVFIHAGMPKTGSTSVQEWLRLNAATLREAHALTPIVDHGPFDDTLGLVTYEKGPFIASNRFLMSYYGALDVGAGQGPVNDLCRRLGDELRAAADEHGDVILTAEGFGRIVFEAEAPALAALEALSQHHTVRVISYVRPQHDALESRWRQWGYHNATSPSEWFSDQLATLCYHTRTRAAQELAPNVHFDLRPFRRDLLEGRDVVVDFARYLGRGEELAAAGSIHKNPGLSLDLTILLRGGGGETTATPAHLQLHGVETGARQVTLAAATKDWELPTSAQASAARAAIHSIAHTHFADDNADLVRTQGWATDAFVPPPGGPSADLQDLDELLRPHIEPAHLAYFHRALADLCARHENESHS